MDADRLLDMAFGAVFGFAIGAVIFAVSQGNQWQREAIRHGAAHYDLDSGEFKWNESEVK